MKAAVSLLLGVHFYIFRLVWIVKGMVAKCFLFNMRPKDFNVNLCLIYCVLIFREQGYLLVPLFPSSSLSLGVVIGQPILFNI